MQYFEVDTFYDEVPAWAAAVLSLGYRWNLGCSNARRIGLLSMPCESEAAGLIALGALRSDLERTTANNVDMYFDFLVRTCRERIAAKARRETFLEAPSWDMCNSDDNTRWCFVAFDDELDAIVLEKAAYRPFVKKKGKIIPNPHGVCTCYIMRGNALRWQLRDCPLPQLPPDGNGLEYSEYNDLPGCVGTISEANLRQSYDGLVLVGKGGARDSSYMQKLYAAGFATADRKFSLGDLLTLHHTERKYIRRISFLNERAHQDAGVHAAWLVVADGISALFCAEKLFPSSDIIGVCNRDASVESLLQLKDWLNNISRYYKDTDASNCLLGEMQTGMQIRVLQQRK